MTHPNPDRRRLLANFAALSFVAVADHVSAKPLHSAEGSDAAKQLGPTRELNLTSLREAQKLAAVEFTDNQLSQLVGSVKRGVEGMVRARTSVPLTNSDAPADVFQPHGHHRSDSLSQGRVHAVAQEKVTKGVASKDLHWLPVHELARLVRDRQVTSTELVERAISRLERFGKSLECVITLLRADALQAAKAADAEIAAGQWRGPLHGIPYGLKDLFAVKGSPTTWGAAPFKDQVIDEDAAVYSRLKEAGAILCAKLTLGALAMGDVWFGGKTRNPWNLEQGSSGSSAGSAAAVAGGLLPFALGTETLGSIVSPSTRCGVTGLRPSFGRVSRFGAMALSWTMDKVGPITRSARDAAIILSAIHGADPRDPSSVTRAFNFRPVSDLSTLRIGYVPDVFQGDKDDSDTKVLAQLKKLGAALVPVELPSFDTNALRVILNVEGAAAFDELVRSPGIDQLVRQGRGSWPRIFRAGRFVPAVEYVQASRRRRCLGALWEQLFASIDVLVAPSFRGGVLLPTNLTGHPTCVMPNGFGDSGQRPRSISFVGGLYREEALMSVSCAWQESTQWHLKRPPLD